MSAAIRGQISGGGHAPAKAGLRDLLKTVHRIDEAGATFKSLTDTWADSTTPHGKLTLLSLLEEKSK